MVFSSPVCRRDDNSVYILHSSLLSDRKLNLAVYHVLYYRKEGNTLNKECGPVPLLGEHFRNDFIHIRCSRCSVHFLLCTTTRNTCQDWSWTKLILIGCSIFLLSTLSWFSAPHNLFLLSPFLFYYLLQVRKKQRQDDLHWSKETRHSTELRRESCSRLLWQKQGKNQRFLLSSQSLYM